MPCDPDSDTCQYRPCDKDSSKCLPNKLSYYKSYIVKAKDFKKCRDNTCLNECASGLIQCNN